MRRLAKAGILTLLVVGIWMLAACRPASSAASYISTGDGGWEWAKPTPSGQWLWGVFFLDDKTGWIAGQNGRIMKTTDGGKTWKRQPSGATAMLGGLFFISDKIGWVSGVKGTILKTTDGGETWVKQNSGTDQQLTKVSFVDEKNGWVIGSAIVHTSDGGETWTVQDPRAWTGLWDAFFFDRSNGWAVGGTGIMHTSTAGMPGAIWAKTQPDGTRANFGASGHREGV